MFYWFIMPLAALVFSVYFRIKIIGRENIPKNHSFVLLSNHVNAIDPVLIVCARFFGQKMLILGKSSLFVNPILAFFFGAVGVVPIERGKGDMKTVENAISEVQGGRPLLIFAEGTRSKTGELLPLKSGAFVIAAKANAPILPCHIEFIYSRIPFLTKVIIVFGKEISIERLAIVGQNTKTLKAAKTLVANELIQLKEQGRADS